MKRTHLIAVLVSVVAMSIFAADASAFYHPSMGRFTSRDPGAGGDMRIGAAGAAPVSGFIPRDRYRDGPNLSEYVRSSPVNLVDPAGLAAVDPGKDCGLSSNSDWGPFLGKDEGKPSHFWLKGNGEELWDFGPDNKWLIERYGNDHFGDCGIFKYCPGKANWGDNAYAGRVGTHASHSLKLQGDFLFFEAKLQDGPKKGTPCKCATCGDIKGCLDAIRQKWNGTRYDHLSRNCGTFALEAMGKCCLRE